MGRPTQLQPLGDARMSDLPARLRATWPLLPEAGPVTRCQRALAHEAAAYAHVQASRVGGEHAREAPGWARGIE